MTYLSRIRINPLRENSRRLLRNPHAMHGAVMYGVPDRPLEERILWRLDSDNPHRPVLFVLTETKPDWTHIVEQAGWPGADGDHAMVRDYTPLLARIAVGREFAFRLTASPVQNTKNPVKPTPEQRRRMEAGLNRSFRIGHRTSAQQLDWFLDRTRKWGFEIPEVAAEPAGPGLEPLDDGASIPRDMRIISRGRLSFRKDEQRDASQGKTRPKEVTLTVATFEGRLRVTNTDLLTERLLGGIGPSKAYGCGLLTLAPLPGARSLDG
ncbi:type I-E CRISPR-associated protein Cas6/Cse3/CasE [Herbidospora daliensis]|uniref:type I-E CRISPR-associated protein Cas6/Cse3/CasE n=1 Tax=Herbidospora daliensis TaxID=295585 RepID=UPI000784E726|nr:type I-E CRISPR-associated protein Cas6/Cse3/CasE [Herbidospora daliensis]